VPIIELFTRNTTFVLAKTDRCDKITEIPTVHGNAGFKGYLHKTQISCRATSRDNKMIVSNCVARCCAT
jgi:hypothetical protein